MKILVTGSKGFIAKNLIQHLREQKEIEVIEFSRENSLDDLKKYLTVSDFVFHLAGENRPKVEADFVKVNVGLTEFIVNELNNLGRKIPLVFTSSIQADLQNLYGKSKFTAEKYIKDNYLGPLKFIYRLPNVFGKWSRPNYNSAVATFCYNIARGLPITVNDPNAVVNLVYVDDVISNFLNCVKLFKAGTLTANYASEVTPVYKLTVGEIRDKILAYSESRTNLITEDVGVGVDRALYATFLSFYAPEQFHYRLPSYADNRGVFVEMLKTKVGGQFSFFTAKPGIVRGMHYHHTKSEKFLVLTGMALFKFRNISTNEIYEKVVHGEEFTIVESIPGWSHSIQNIGESEMFVMLWANEIFDKLNPDTIGHEV